MRSIRMIVKNFERSTRNQTPSIGSPAPRTDPLPGPPAAVAGGLRVDRF